MTIKKNSVKQKAPIVLLLLAIILILLPKCGELWQLQTKVKKDFEDYQVSVRWGVWKKR